MRLGAGTRLGPYEILGPIGAGGMGDVYRARDTRLGRRVAIKLIRDEFAQHDEFRQRFEREARTISALNHPHVCALYDVGEQGPSPYLVMEYVEGETLAAMLARGPLPLELALRYAAQIADALAAAHAIGVIHRDLKPANLMITAAGIKVLDFGLAKHTHAITSDEETGAVSAPATRTDQVVGTVAYMSPEQADGRLVDAHSDVFSLGVVLYEMLAGTPPFRGDTTLSTLAAILRETPQSPRKTRHEIPIRLEQIVLRCLEKRPDARWSSAAELRRELEACGTPSPVPRRDFIRRPIVVVGIAALFIVAGVAGAVAVRRASAERWARAVALPEVNRLMTAGRPLLSLKLLRQAQPYLASHDALRLEDALVPSRVSVETTPAGAEVYIRDYLAGNDDDLAHWEHLGRSPVQVDAIPRGSYRVLATRHDIEPTRAVAFIGFGTPAIRITLHPKADAPAGMVWVPGLGSTGVRGQGQSFPALTPQDSPEFWIDKYEVTNADFKRFVDQGGYRRRDYWKHTFIKDGRTLSWEQAMAEFHDATGRTGPAGWQLGAYPDGRANYPVGGVSWYEAAAYAEFAGKSLPTVYHWIRAAGVLAEILRFANFGGQGAKPVDSLDDLGPFGTYGMGGNLKEWTLNPSADRRYIMGGAWNEPNYMFSRPDARRPFERAAAFGFRCARYPVPIAQALTGPVAYVNRDRRNDKPVDDRTFEIFKGLHAYDKSDLMANVESVDETVPYWRKENVTFQAAYGNERVLAHLYLPQNGKPPFSTLVFMGGSSNLTNRTMEDSDAAVVFGFVVRAGRAVMVPAYKGTLERGPGAYYHSLGQPNLWREMNLQWSKDLGRSIDYLETRPDIAADKIGYFGLSMGAAMAPRLVAMEPRLRTALLISGGSFEKVPPEVDAWNFASRITIPVLMLNARDDFLFPLETSQLPLFRLLGTPEKDKRHVLFEGGHGIGNTGANLDVVRESLDWLDRYLGPVRQ
jgi:formylglycine-generating enzyme required for sulfatase activity/dienelactone hydrolase